jgi:hypothetical protein
VADVQRVLADFFGLMSRAGPSYGSASGRASDSQRRTRSKTCLGSQSEKGFRFVERILTTVESLRAQGRDVLGFLVETMNAAAQGRAPPSLLPPPPG